jgi:hypothetical protein
MLSLSVDMDTFSVYKSAILDHYVNILFLWQLSSQYATTRAVKTQLYHTIGVGYRDHKIMIS